MTQKLPALNTTKSFSSYDPEATDGAYTKKLRILCTLI